jgi:DNA polymerase-3 subunit alpha
VKFDFLGLKTLTVIEKAWDLIGRDQIDIPKLPLDDKRTFELLAPGDGSGVFQLEGNGMRDVLRKLKPDRFEDIIAVVALYRPGPMENIPSYIKRKHGEETPDYLHPLLEGILKETYGIMIYQEQVMQIAQVLSGYTLGGADLLRRAMGKKIQSEMMRSARASSRARRKTASRRTGRRRSSTRSTSSQATASTRATPLPMRWSATRPPISRPIIRSSSSPRR